MTICYSPAATPRERQDAIGTKADPVMLEVFNNLFMSIAEQMGVALQNTAQSVNIKERLDFSCAIFNGEGQLVANAPHVPVHLGSMDRSVETIIRDNEGKTPRRRRLHDQRAVQWRDPPARHHRDHAGVRRNRQGHSLLCGEPRPSCGRGRHHAGLHESERHHHQRGRHLYRQFPARRRWQVPRECDPRPC